jgi:hypothetical protein
MPVCMLYAVVAKSRVQASELLSLSIPAAKKAATCSADKRAEPSILQRPSAGQTLMVAESSVEAL